jgi:hypothetical protein
MELMEVMCYWESRIGTQLQLMEEFELFANYEM